MGLKSPEHLNRLENFLKLLAKRSLCVDFLLLDDPQKVSGGNFDDCYDLGSDDGETELAKNLLNEYFK